ncbi:MAG: hypothetical protein GF383_00645 [Candidatus Lokiarchaeota archaeon]|nr:hypothetical protein [Candidatus Lokiarchaeota archaeon]MBD3337681.1 hypothetical protein [Candidatus Lokiarchaeota archaeon]
MLEPIELLNGILSIIFVAISIMVGIRILIRYFEHKQRTFLLVGLTWIGLVSIWYASSLSVILILLTGYGINDHLYMLIGNGLLPITSFIWMIAFTDLMYKDKQLVILVLFGIYNALFEIFFLYFLVVDMSFLGEVTGPVDATYGWFVTFYQFSMLILIIITGTLFSRESIKSDNLEINLKGKLLLIAFYALVLGAILEIFSHLSILILIFARLILIFSSLACYGGFILPSWLKNLFI